MSDEDMDIFKDVPALSADHAVSPGGDGDERRSETDHILNPITLAAMSHDDLVELALQQHKTIRRLESDTKVVSWEFHESRDYLAYFSGAVKLAHKLSASDVDTIAHIVTTELPAYYGCRFATLFLIGEEDRQFNLVASTVQPDAATLDVDNPAIQAFLDALLRGPEEACIANYSQENRLLELDNGTVIPASVPPKWLELVGREALILPLRLTVTGVRGPESRFLGGIIVGDAQRELDYKVAEVSVLFTDLIAASINNAQLLQKLNTLSIQDPLTQLYNRRHLIDRLEEAIRQADRHCQPLSIAMADIDFFKRFNDCYGHLCGDAVLREFSVILKSGVRAGVDIPARYGGEEFLLILPFTDLHGAGEVSDRIRRAVEQMMVQYDGLKLSVTCSFGVTQYQPGESIQKFIDRADEALYTAKAGGRNRVYLAE